MRTLEKASGSYPNWGQTAKANVHNQVAIMLEDSLATCRFKTRTNVDYVSPAISVATGWNLWGEG
jgi:aldehyde:ferredoxin oxidoreductase